MVVAQAAEERNPTKHTLPKIFENFVGRWKLTGSSFACVGVRAAERAIRSMVLFVADHRHRRIGAGGGGGGGAASCALGLCAECGYQHQDGN